MSYVRTIIAGPIGFDVYLRHGADGTDRYELTACDRGLQGSIQARLALTYDDVADTAVAIAKAAIPVIQDSLGRVVLRRLREAGLDEATAVAVTALIASEGANSASACLQAAIEELVSP